jgi:hypothetical protein
MTKRAHALSRVVRLCALGLFFSPLILAVAADQPTYFILDGNPAAVKYVAGRLVRLPTQDADDLDGMQSLESVAAIQRARRLTGLSSSPQPLVAQASSARETEYGTAMFEVTVDGVVVKRSARDALFWTGPARFREVSLGLGGLDARQRQLLVADSRRALIPALDLKGTEGVRRVLHLEGTPRVRDHGRSAVAPDLGFVDVTWRIKDFPKMLANQGIDSMQPAFRVEYVVNTRSGKTIFRDIINTEPDAARSLRLFKEPNGPLLMAVSIACLDGAEPLILDLENESYGTGRANDVQPAGHCFPAQ